MASWLCQAPDWSGAKGLPLFPCKLSKHPALCSGTQKHAGLWEATLMFSSALSPSPTHRGQRLLVAIPLKALWSFLTSSTAASPPIPKPRLLYCLESGKTALQGSGT